MAKKKAKKKDEPLPKRSKSKKLDLWKNPTGFGGSMAGKAEGYFRAVGIDLATYCGYAWVDFKQGQQIEDLQVFAGQWLLDVGAYDTGPLRFIRLKQFLSILQPDLIGYEDVKFSPSKELRGKPVNQVVSRIATAAELLGAFKITLTTWAEERGLPAEGFAITKIKKHATGKGVANKVDMINAANAQFGTQLDPETYESTGADNIADAMFVLDMVLRNNILGVTA